MTPPDRIFHSAPVRSQSLKLYRALALSLNLTLVPGGFAEAARLTGVPLTETVSSNPFHMAPVRTLIDLLNCSRWGQGRACHVRSPQGINSTQLNSTRSSRLINQLTTQMSSAQPTHLTASIKFIHLFLPSRKWPSRSPMVRLLTFGVSVSSLISLPLERRPLPITLKLAPSRLFALWSDSCHLDPL